MSEEDKKIPKSDLSGNDEASNDQSEDGETSERTADTAELQDPTGHEMASSDKGGDGEISDKKNMDIPEDEKDQTDDEMQEIPHEDMEGIAGPSYEGLLKKVRESEVKIKKLKRTDTESSDSLDDSIRKDIEGLEGESDSQSSLPSAKGFKGVHRPLMRLTYQRRENYYSDISDSSGSQNSPASDPKTSSSSDGQLKTKQGIEKMDTESSDSLDDSVRKDLEGLDVESKSRSSKQDSNPDPMRASQVASCSHSKETSSVAVQSHIKRHGGDSLRLLNINELLDENGNPIRLSDRDLEMEACKESSSESPMVEGLEKPEDEIMQRESDSLKESSLNHKNSLTKNSAQDFDSQTSAKVSEPSDEVSTDKLLENNERNPTKNGQILLVACPDTADKVEKPEEVDNKAIESEKTLSVKEAKEGKSSEGEFLQERAGKRKSEDLSFRSLRKTQSDNTLADTESHEDILEQTHPEKAKDSEKMQEIHSKKRKLESQEASPSTSHRKSIKVEPMEYEDLKIPEASGSVPESEGGASLTSDSTESCEEALQSRETEVTGKRKKLSSSEESESPPMTEDNGHFMEPEEFILMDPADVQKEGLI